MLVDLYRVRDRGWVLPRFRSAFLPPVRAKLQVIERYDTTLYRNVRVATALCPTTLQPIDEVPELIDVQLVKIESPADGIAPSVITLAGFERIHDGVEVRKREYAQSWFCRCVSQAISEPASVPASPEA